MCQWGQGGWRAAPPLKVTSCSAFFRRAAYCRSVCFLMTSSSVVSTVSAKNGSVSSLSRQSVGAGSVQPCPRKMCSAVAILVKNKQPTANDKNATQAVFLVTGAHIFIELGEWGLEHDSHGVSADDLRNLGAQKPKSSSWSVVKGMPVWDRIRRHICASRNPFHNNGRIIVIALRFLASDSPG